MHIAVPPGTNTWHMHVGEIIPQAVCSRHGLAVGARSAWFVQILMWTFAVIAYPISKVLDYLLGQEHTVSLKLSLAHPAFRIPSTYQGTLTTCRKSQQSICMFTDNDHGQRWQQATGLQGSLLQDACSLLFSSCAEPV